MAKNTQAITTHLNYRMTAIISNKSIIVAEFHAVDAKHAAITARAIRKPLLVQYKDHLNSDDFTLTHLVTK